MRRLQELREDAGHTQKELGDAIGWSQSKVQRIEHGLTAITPADLFYLLHHLGFGRETEESKELEALLQVARARPRFGEFKELVTDRNFDTFLQEEGAANSLRQFQGLLIPGPLQTRDYTIAVQNEFLDVENAPEDAQDGLRTKAEKIASFRQARKKDLLAREKNSFRADFLLDEAAVRRQVGREAGRVQVMIEQLIHLKTLATHTHIDIGVIPFSGGANVGMLGPFVILDFEDEDDPPLLFVENSSGDYVTKENVDEINRLIYSFKSLQDRAVRGKEFDEFIDGLVKEMSADN